MKKKKLLLPILLLAPAFLASQVAADEQTAPETSLEAAPASTNATDAATPASTEASTATSEGATESSAELPEANILHTNDVHGRIVEEKGVIGDAKLAAVIDEERAKNPSTLVVDAGDAFQGLPISNSSKGDPDGLKRVSRRPGF